MCSFIWNSFCLSVCPSVCLVHSLVSFHLNSRLFCCLDLKVNSLFLSHAAPHHGVYSGWCFESECAYGMLDLFTDLNYNTLRSIKISMPVQHTYSNLPSSIDTLCWVERLPYHGGCIRWCLLNNCAREEQSQISNLAWKRTYFSTFVRNI